MDNLAMRKPSERRAICHYTLAVFLFSLYCIVVSPFFEVHSPVILFLHTTFIFMFLYGFRRFGRFIKNKNISIRTQLLAFTLTGFCFASWYNVSFDLPWRDDIKFVFGFFCLGLLINIDLAIDDARHDMEQDVVQSTPPLTKVPLALIAGNGAIVIVLMMVVLLILILSKEFFWILEHATHTDSLQQALWLIDHPEYRVTQNDLERIIYEFIFVALTIVGYIAAISRNGASLIHQQLDKQIQVMQVASEGNLTQRIPLNHAAELNEIAFYTNQMLGQLTLIYDELNRSRDATIIGLSTLAEVRDNETGAHILRTQRYVKTLAEELKKSPKHQDFLTNDVIELLFKSAPLHDVGKVGIPDSILLKPGKLTEEEFKIMKNHPLIGAAALQTTEKNSDSSAFLKFAIEIAATHHEKWDGTGYPVGLVGDAIPLSGRLMALADVYDALICKRVYKPAFSHEATKDIILAGKGTHFDPEIVDAFLVCEQQFIQIAQKYKETEKPT